MSNSSEFRGNPPPVPPVVEGNPPPVPPVQTLSASRPGYKTTDFWLTVLASIVGVLMASGAFPDGGQMAQILGWAGLILANLGYQGNRAFTKGAEAKAMASAADSVARERALKAALAPSGAPAILDPTKRSRSTE